MHVRDLRWPVVVAAVVLTAMFAAFTVTRSDAATGTQNAVPNQTIQSESATPDAQPRDREDCPEKDGNGGGRGRGHGGPGGGSGDQGSSAPAPQQTAPDTTDL